VTALVERFSRAAGVHLILALTFLGTACVEQKPPQSAPPPAAPAAVRPGQEQVDNLVAEMERLSNLIPVGSEAPDFSQQSPDGRTIALSSLRGKVVLIDFWASWCKPCRMENPNVKKVYEKYHRKGFEILGVSLDRDMDAWKNAIQQDGLPWLHVSDLGFWNNAAAQQYGISSIPFTVLVDKDGKVIDKNLRGPALEAKLAEIFGG